MSKVSVVILLIVAVGLSVGAYFMFAGGGPATPGTPGATTGGGESATVLAFDPARVTSIAVAHSGGTERAARTASAGWAFEPSDGWPLDPTRVNAALNSIANLESFPTADGDAAPLGAQTIAVTVGLDDGTSHTVTVSRNAAGGRAPATIDGGAPVLLPASALGLFDPDQGFGPAAWRVTGSALPGADNPTRIRITHAGNVTALERTSSGWRMTEPIDTPAGDVTPELRTLLAGVDMLGFSPARVLVPPTITVTTADGTRSLGLMSSPGLESVATITLPSGTQNIRVRGGDLDTLLNPARFLPRTLFDGAPGDVRVLGTTNNAYEQTLDGWTDDAGDALADPVATSVNALLTAMTDGTATPSILDAPDTAEAFLTVVSRTGQPLGTFRATQTAAGLRLSADRLAWTLPPTVIAPWLNPADDTASPATPTEPIPPVEGGTGLPEK